MSCFAEDTSLEKRKTRTDTSIPQKRVEVTIQNTSEPVDDSCHTNQVKKILTQHKSVAHCQKESLEGQQGRCKEKGTFSQIEKRRHAGLVRVPRRPCSRSLKYCWGVCSF